MIRSTDDHGPARSHIEKADTAEVADIDPACQNDECAWRDFARRVTTRSPAA